MMDWQCQTCGAQMFLRASFGHWFLLCPLRHDGTHPVVRTWTSNGSADPPLPIFPRTTRLCVSWME